MTHKNAFTMEKTTYGKYHSTADLMCA